MPYPDIQVFLDEKVEKYNQQHYFLKDDPIGIPHLFTAKEDIEIIGFIVATIAWGKRPMIIKNSNRILEIMGNQPLQYILHASEEDLNDFEFVHRTFNKTDLQYFVLSLRNLYAKQRSIESVFAEHQGNMAEKIHHFRKVFFSLPHESRTTKHVSDPLKNSAAKRLNMYLRWMVRKDQKGVDFGLWKGISPAELYCPLDVHTGNVARKLGLIERKANDWKALEELMTHLRKFDPIDPVKYDFALFGLGVYEGF
ncbi:TIGR02757 family protein [Putridiphycobacter roseus]|uniref:TIGR02757 family protein n=1 Tax=Putridiphycobacter roseus TaxID=2219161 RepID=A0A2W1NU03_9FLAO|nr:TIGR02757 family protein [Putridiphycobacter roseus]PZE18238.1 TIGR02757 family protein [Putridiphycobacter roseus]